MLADDASSCKNKPKSWLEESVLNPMLFYENMPKYAIANQKVSSEHN